MKMIPREMVVTVVDDPCIPFYMDMNNKFYVGIEEQWKCIM